tara:strand:+ start:619 stop:810 length:192 start_codon:yes stop_codon:yes gene_type:complete
MKKLLLCIPFIFILGCQKNDEEMMMWSCVENECLYAYNQIHQELYTPMYVALEDCLNDCPQTN